MYRQLADRHWGCWLWTHVHTYVGWRAGEEGRKEVAADHRMRTRMLDGQSEKFTKDIDRKTKPKD